MRIKSVSKSSRDSTVDPLKQCRSWDWPKKGVKRGRRRAVLGGGSELRAVLGGSELRAVLGTTVKALESPLAGCGKSLKLWSTDCVV